MSMAYNPRLSCILLSIAGLVVFIGSLWLHGSLDGKNNLHAHQAKVFLEGHIDLGQYHHDVAVYQGRFYSPFPPFPAVLLLPAVAVLGVSGTKVLLVSILFTVLSAFLLTRILRILLIDSKVVPWMLIAFFFGTAYWLCLLWSSGVWFYAHIVSVTCMLLGIHEVFHKGRGYLAGLFLGLAFLSRQLTIFAFAFFAVALWEHSSLATREKRARNILGFVFALSLCIGIYLVFNWLRFSGPLDTGYSYLRLKYHLADRTQIFGLFHPAYLLYNFTYMFLQGPHIEFAPPTYLKVQGMDGSGTSLTFASPFIFTALWARWQPNLLWAAWLSILMILIPMLFYYNNGWAQLNAIRLSMDFFPILVLLVALGTRRVRPAAWKSAIVYSVALNIIALFGLPAVQRIGNWF
jgi:4-amino-4-deoxy-L-arabinose transferase-like glycosyltransferase